MQGGWIRRKSARHSTTNPAPRHTNTPPLGEVPGSPAYILLSRLKHRILDDQVVCVTGTEDHLNEREFSCAPAEVEVDIPLLRVYHLHIQYRSLAPSLRFPIILDPQAVNDLRVQSDGNMTDCLLTRRLPPPAQASTPQTGNPSETRPHLVQHLARRRAVGQGRTVTPLEKLYHTRLPQSSARIANLPPVAPVRGTGSLLVRTLPSNLPSCQVLFALKIKIPPPRATPIPALFSPFNDHFHPFHQPQKPPPPA